MQVSCQGKSVRFSTGKADRPCVVSRLGPALQCTYDKVLRLSNQLERLCKP